MKRIPPLFCAVFLASPAFGQVQINEDPEPDLHSPVYVELDAPFLKDLDTARFDEWFPVTGVKQFYVDDATLMDPEVRLHLNKKTRDVTVQIRFNMYVRDGAHDKAVGFDYFLVRQPSLVDHIDDDRNVWAMPVEEGHPKKQWVYSFNFKPDVLGKDDEPKIRIVMTVTND